MKYTLWLAVRKLKYTSVACSAWLWSSSCDLLDTTFSTVASSNLVLRAGSWPSRSACPTLFFLSHTVIVILKTVDISLYKAVWMSCYHVELLVMLFFLNVLCEMLTVMLFIWTVIVRCSPVDSELGWKVNSFIGHKKRDFFSWRYWINFYWGIHPKLAISIFMTYF